MVYCVRRRVNIGRGGVWAAFLTLMLIAAACGSRDTVPRLERQASEINREVMCPVCPGESIDQSQNPLAIQMRGLVAEKLEEGWSGGQIKTFFVERYGPSVLLEPPREGFNLLAWTLPPIGAVLMLAVLFIAVGQMRSRGSAETEDSGEPSLTNEERSEYGRIIEGALGLDAAEGRTDRSPGGSGPDGRGAA